MTPSPIRVLIADDSQVVRQAISRRLAGKGLDVVEAESEEEALAFDAALLSAVVLDLELGVADGTMVAERIRAANAQVRIAFFTSGSTDAVLTKARAIGPVFSKPDEIDDLVTWIVAPV